MTKPANKSNGLNNIGEISPGDLPTIGDVPAIGIKISKRSLKRVEHIELVRNNREDGSQQVGFNSRCFVLCGLPIKRPPKDQLEHLRRNGKFTLSVIGHPRFGLPFGQDRLIPIWAATEAIRRQSRIIEFNAASEILDLFGLPKDGYNYARLIEGFNRVFRSSMFFEAVEGGGPVDRQDLGRFDFFDRVSLWYTKNLDQGNLPLEGYRNSVVLSERFWKELQSHPIPIDLAVIRGLTDSPGAMDFYMWIAWRCWKVKGQVSIPLLGTDGLMGQLGGSVADPWKFRQTIRRWLKLTKSLWPECPAVVAEDGEHLLISPGKALKGA